MITYSSPFLATDLKQMVPVNSSKIKAVEATLFNRQDLDKHVWNAVWHNVSEAVNQYGADNVSFHFPVNDCDYVADNLVYHRLCDAFQRASDLGLCGVVVHANRIRDFPFWHRASLENERCKVVDVLHRVLDKKSSHTWLALENMPVMDNSAKEIDPLFVFPEDFTLLTEIDIGIVWDFCHYSNSLANMDLVRKKIHDVRYYPNVQNSEYLDFIRLSEKIVHWHFSSFQGIANPITDEICREGVLPTEGTLPESIYRDAWNYIVTMPKTQKVVFEIQEKDYYIRDNMKKMIRWCDNDDND